MASHEFRFIVSDVELTDDQKEKVSNAIAEAGLRALGGAVTEEARESFSPTDPSIAGIRRSSFGERQAGRSEHGGPALGQQRAGTRGFALPQRPKHGKTVPKQRVLRGLEHSRGDDSERTLGLRRTTPQGRPELAERLRSEGRPESRYRFSGPCHEAGCPQWTGGGCFVVDHILDGQGEAAESGAQAGVQPTSLPPCGIRGSCRWFHQRGANACAVCPLVVADMGYRYIPLPARLARGVGDSRGGNGRHQGAAIMQ